MRNAGYVFRRKESGVFFFRWRIPSRYRQQFNGKREFRHTLHTTDQPTALRLARKLVALLDSQLLQVAMPRQELPAMYALIELLLRQPDGAIRMEGVKIENEQDVALIQKILGQTKDQAPETTETKLSQLIADFLAEGEKAERWTDKSKQELVESYALLLEIVSDKPVASITRKHLSDFKTVLGKLPRNRNKDARYRGKSALELAGMAIPKESLLAVRTMNKVMHRASTLFAWAVRHGHIASNVAEGQTLAVGKRRDASREVYADEEARRLIAAVLPETVPWRKWIPLIGLYSGARLNEIAQLEVGDFQEVDGVPVFVVNEEGEGKRVKTHNANRVVPVHPKLVETGLLEHVEQLRASGEKRMWPQLPLSRDGYGKTPSRWFGEQLRPRVKLTQPFHSLRHTVVHKLREAGIPEDVVADIVGHERSGNETFGTYAKSASVKRTYPAICKLNYD